MPFSRGSVVVMKSGGPRLIVSDIVGDMVRCLWIGEEGERARQLIPASALMEAASHDEEQEEDEPDHEDNGGSLDAEVGDEIALILASALTERPDKVD